MDNLATINVQRREKALGVFDQMRNLILAAQSQKEITEEVARQALYTCHLFVWLYEHAEEFTADIQKRVGVQIEEIKEGFAQGRYPAYSTLDEAYDAEVLSHLIDTEIIAAINRDIPHAQEKGIATLIVEHGSNVVVVLEGSEAQALVNLEQQFAAYLEEGCLHLQKVIVLTDPAKQLACIRALGHSECYPGRLANVKLALNPPAAPTLYQKAAAEMGKGKDPIIQMQSALMVIAATYQEQFPQGTLAEFILFAKAQLQGPLSGLGVSPNVLDDSAVLDVLRYMFE
jgi:hypothetical protein